MGIKFKFTQGIFSRLLGYFILVGGIPLVISILIVISNFETTQRKSVIDFVGLISDRKTREIAEYFRERVDDIILLGSNPAIIQASREFMGAYSRSGILSPEYNALSQKYGNYLTKYKNIMKLYDLFIISPDGEVVYTVTRESDFSTNVISGKYKDTHLAKVFKHSKSFLEASISELSFYDPSQDEAFFISSPIFLNNTFIGVLAAQIDKRKILSILTSLQGMGPTGEIVLGRFVDNRIFFDTLLRDHKSVSIGENLALPMQDAVLGGRGRGVSIDYNGTQVVAAWNYLPELNWGVVVKVDSRNAFEAVNTAKKVSYILLLLILSAMVAAALYSSNGIVEPIRELTNISKKITEGNFNVRLFYNSNDEIAELAKSFNQMTDKLEITMQDLQESRKKLLISHVDLEKRVNERTLELEESNLQLKSEVLERKATEGQLKLAAQVIENTSEAVIVTDIDGTIIQVNSAYSRITGFTQDEVVGKNPRISKSGKHSAEFYREMWSSILSTGRWEGEIWDRRKDGSIYPKWLSINTIKDEHDIPKYYIGIFKDITQIKQTQEELNRLAFYDPLTGLPNRLLFQERLRQEIALYQRTHFKTGVFFIDLNRFKYINDSLGHSIGDKVLQEVAKRLKLCVRESDTVSRLGGDEFTLLIRDVKKTENLVDIAQDVINKMKPPITLDDRDLYVDAAIGISVFPDDGMDMESILKNSDTAMYKAKSEGAGAFYFFSTEMNVQGNTRLEIETLLRLAIDRNEFMVYYQPIYSIKNEKVEFYEALIRWNHETMGFISPDTFIPIAEETGMIPGIEDIVMETVCAQINDWKAKGFQTVPVAINVSPVQFKNNLITEKINALLNKYNLDSSEIEFELTERVLMDESEITRQTFIDLREMGLRFSLDDFGTGFSSLSYLNKFEVFKLKIDRSFTNQVTDDYKSAALTKAIVSIGKSLGIEIVAEGVETVKQLEFFKEAGCDYIQGYYFSKPVPPENAQEFLEKGRD